MLNRRWLLTFQTLVETGHFTRAAERLAMTQPGVSQHLKKLESAIGTALIANTGKQFELTDAGRTLYRYVQRLETDENAVLQSLREDDPHVGICRVGCSGSLALTLYPHFLQRQLQYPGLQISLEAAPNARILDYLSEDRIDLGIITHRRNAEEFDEIALGHQRLALMLPAAMNISAAFPSLDELDQLGFVNHPDGHHYAEQLLHTQFGSRFTGIRRMKDSGYVNQIHQILVPVSMGLGFTALPRAMADTAQKPGSIRVFEPDTPVKEPLTLVTKRHRPLPARYEWFVEALKVVLAEI